MTAARRFRWRPYSNEDGRRGMSLRDYFAAKVLANITLRDGEDWSAAVVAAYCYKQADAMLKERSKP